MQMLNCWIDVYTHKCGGQSERAVITVAIDGFIFCDRQKFRESSFPSPQLYLAVISTWKHGFGQTRNIGGLQIYDREFYFS